MRSAGTRNKHAFPQLQLYQRCLDTFGGNHRHMAFIDSDEASQGQGDRVKVEATVRVQTERRTLHSPAYRGAAAYWCHATAGCCHQHVGCARSSWS